MSEKFRCFGNNPLYEDYHDNEWGRPVHDDVKLFEMLILEGAQAGLSWETVLKKRAAYKDAFDGFDPEKAALFDNVKIEELMANTGIIRNRLKINAAVINARLFLQIAEQYGSFDRFIWKYVDYTPVVGHWERFEDIPLTTPISDQISKDLKKMGFKFVGSTIIYSFMQAVGMVNDHLTKCFIYAEIATIREATKADLPQILELYKELQPEDPPINEDTAIAVWEQAVANGVRYFVAEDEGRVVASCYIAIIPNITRDCSPIGFIENVITASGYRHRGIGKKLLGAAVDYAKNKGCYKVTLQSGNNRSGAHDFYGSIGFDGNAKQAFEIRF